MKKTNSSRWVKVVKGIGWTFAAILLTLNLFVVLSGRYYLYKGIYYTYLSGETSPTIYDKDKFESSTLPAATKKQPWALHKKSGAHHWSKKDLAYFDSLGTTSFLVFYKDSLLSETYLEGHTQTTVSNSFSAAKTVVSMLIGIAQDEGYIKSLDDAVSKYIPEFSGKGKDKITIRHLLMMASGLDWKESSSDPLSENAASYYGSDLWNLVLSQQAITEPGKLFNYQSGNSQLLGYVIEKATGKDLTAYADEKLWQPMGAESDAFWSLDKKGGDEKAFCCLYSTARDFARIAYLLGHEGKWKDKQIIPANYFKEMVSNPKMATEEGIPNLRYGLHIWTYLAEKNPIYYCRGIHGQYIMAIPSENILIVRTGRKRTKDYAGPTGEIGNTKISKKELPLVGHPKDILRYLEMARRVVGEVK